MSEPLKISVITACYNSQATIGEAIATLKRQCWPHVEHVVIDGGSKDDTVAMPVKLVGIWNQAASNR